MVSGAASPDLSHTSQVGAKDPATVAAQYETWDQEGSSAKTACKAKLLRAFSKRQRTDASNNAHQAAHRATGANTFGSFFGVSPASEAAEADAFSHPKVNLNC